MGIRQRRSLLEENRQRWLLQPRGRWFAPGLAVCACLYLVLLIFGAFSTGAWSQGDWLRLGLGIFWVIYATNTWFTGSTGTTVSKEGLIVRDGWKVTDVAWEQVTAIRADRDDRWATHLLAVLVDGRELRLSVVPVGDQEALREWAPNGSSVSKG